MAAPEGLAAPASAGEIGRRFEALAREPDQGELSSVGPGIDAALVRLKSTTVGGEAMLPASALRHLGESDPAAAGSLLIGLLASLHRVEPMLKLDLDLRDSVLALTSEGGRTVIESRGSKRRRRDRDLAVRGRPELIARAALGYRTRGVRGRHGIAVLRSLLDFPHAICDLIDDGAVLPPAAVWALVSSSLAAAPPGAPVTVVHRDSGAPAEAITVSAAQGRPISAVKGTCGSADATVWTDPGSTLGWLAGTAEPASITGDAEAAERLRSLFAISCSPIRARS